MNRISVLNALDSLTIPGRDHRVHADVLHAAINGRVLNLGQDTVGHDVLRDLLVDLDYDDVLDGYGRIVWRGLGLFAGKSETTGLQHPAGGSPRVYSSHRERGKPDARLVQRGGVRGVHRR